MSFNSWQFLVFLPIVIIGYYLLPHKIRWIWLLIASYYFYMSWNPWLVFLIAGTTLVSYLAAILIEKTPKKGLKKFYLILTLVICLGCLVFFKYFNFLSQSVIDFLNFFKLNLPSFALDLILPVGISFYTFQTLSYTIDVYRGTLPAEKHLGYYALFVSYFPQLVAGPIERPETLIPQLKEKHTLDSQNLLIGSRILLSGFFRKVVLADFCGVFVNNIYNNLATSHSLSVYLATALFLLEIYFDFSGYSEIALGAARMMGVKLSVNFDKPFSSQSYSEFFRRWHITLNTWFRDYLYIPLGGNRKGVARKVLNLWIVFLLCGLWHGANWTYVLWGAYAAFFISLETLLRKPFLRFCANHKIDLSNSFVRLFRSTLMFLLYVFGGILFRSKDMTMVSLAYTRLFTAFSAHPLQVAYQELGFNTLTLIELGLGLLALVLLYHFCYPQGNPELVNTLPKPVPASEPVSGTMEAGVYAQKASSFVYLVLVIALCWLVLLASQDSSAFAYFQF